MYILSLHFLFQHEKVRKSCLFCTKSVKIVCFSDPEICENNIHLLNSPWKFFHTSSMNPVIVIANEDFSILSIAEASCLVMYLLRQNAYSNCGYYFWTCGDSRANCLPWHYSRDIIFIQSFCLDCNNTYWVSLKLGSEVFSEVCPAIYDFIRTADAFNFIFIFIFFFLLFFFPTDRPYV